MEHTAGEVWSRILEAAKAALPEQAYRTWLFPLPLRPPRVRDLRRDPADPERRTCGGGENREGSRIPRRSSRNDARPRAAAASGSTPPGTGIRVNLNC